MKKLLTLAIVLSVLLIAVPVSANSATLYVDDDDPTCGGNSPCYSHPQDAVNAANPGDTILVYPGTYSERVFTSPRPPHWGVGDQYAPALIVYKDNLTIKAVDPDPSKTVIKTTYNFWVNKANCQADGCHYGGGSIEHSTGCVWNPTTKVWDDNPATPGDCVRPQFGTPPNAISLIANGVTIEGLTVQRPRNPAIGGHDTIMIGGLYAGHGLHGETVGYGGNTIRNCVIDNSTTAVAIWHSSDNLIEDNIIHDIGWRAIQVYDGWSDAEVTVGPPSQNNQFIGNKVYNAWGGLFAGAWNVAPGSTGIRTDSSGTVIKDNHFHDLTDFAVGFGFTNSENVEISGNRMVNGPAGIRTDVAGGSSSSFSNLVIDSNYMRPSQWGILAYALDKATISNNDIWYIQTLWAIAIFDSNDVDILDNDIRDNAYGIAILNSTAVEAHCNNIVGNGAGVDPWGPLPALNNTPGAGDPNQYIVDAMLNWWGDASGPYHPTSWDYMGSPYGPHYGSGDEVSDYVLYDPWKGKVEIDIKPGSDPNSINLKSKGVVPVAVLTTDDFDASTVDPIMVEFAGADPVRWAVEDVDGDGDLDLLFHFKTQELDLDANSTEATLTGDTTDGKSFWGKDTVEIVPKGK